MVVDPIVDVSALPALPRLVLLDCRSGPAARARWAEGHLPGAIFVDLERDLAAPVIDAARGGRHPLPTVADFAACLGRWGVTPTSQVVAYDDQHGANAAARLWWMLRALGHADVRVLDGGLAAALAAGLALTADAPTPPATGAYPAARDTWPTVDIDEVDRQRRRADARVLDVRAAARYRGETEPIDPVAGHIPGAHNIPFSDNLADDRFKSPAALRALYAPLLTGLPPSALTVHCGSGVTACHTLLALARAGLDGAGLYVGSWGEWCRDPTRPRAP